MSLRWSPRPTGVRCLRHRRWLILLSLIGLLSACQQFPF